MHSSDPKGYGTRPGGIPVVTLGTAPMGYLANSVDPGISQQATMQPVQQTPGTSGGHVHLFAAGIVTGAIVLLVIMGIVFPGAVQF